MKTLARLNSLAGASLIALSLPVSAVAAGNPFQTQAIAGYQVADAAMTGKDTEPKNPEGKCGGHNAADTKSAEAKCGAAKTAEAKCGASKTAEAKCGGMKSGDGMSMDMKSTPEKPADSKDMPAKTAEGKCGEAKCGANKKPAKK